MNEKKEFEGFYKGKVTSAFSTKEILGQLCEGKNSITIPNFQRAYVWDKKQWGQLWKDLESCYLSAKSSIDKNAQHFMGMLTLDSNNNLLDGQQRLTTVFILIDCLECLANVNIAKRIVRPASNLLNWDGTNEENQKCKEIYNFFAEKIVNARTVSGDYKKLLDVLLNRFFWIVDYTKDESHRVFEGINASGKEIEFADFILNFILELNEETGRKEESLQIRSAWKKLIGSIYAGGIIPEEFDEEFTEEELISKPLKLKKFLNAMNSVTLPISENFNENIDCFIEVFLRLHNSYACEEKEWNREDLTAEYIKEQIVLWGNLYVYASTPSVFSEMDAKKIFGDISFEKELHVLSTLSTAKIVPMTMRVLYEYICGTFTTKEVEAIFGAVNRALLYPEIFSARTDSNERNSLNKIVYIDRIALAYKKILIETEKWIDENINNEEEKREKKKQLPRFNISSLLCLLMGDELYAEMLHYTEYTDEFHQKVVEYKYNSRFSKAVLMIAHDFVSDRNSTILSIERELREEKGRKRTDFEVEHLVAQNLDAEGYGNYGFDSQTIDNFRNLILLEGDINANVGNKIPSEKMVNWKDSKLWNEYKNYICIDNLHKEEYAFKQENRLKKMTENIHHYLHAAEKFNLVDEILPFMELYYEEGKLKKILPYMPGKNSYVSLGDKLVGENENVLLYYLDKTGNINNTSEDKEDSDEIKRIFFYRDGLFEEIILGGRKVKSKEKGGTIGKAINLFLECWENEKGLDDLRCFLEQHENETGDFNAVSEYESRLFHTVKFRKQNEDNFKKGTIKKVWLKRKQHINRTFTYKESGIEYNCAYSVDQTVRHLRKLYNAANLSFPFWIEASKGIDACVLEKNRGVLMLPYFNIGKGEVFNAWVRKNFVDINNRTEEITEKNICDKIECYFRYEEVSVSRFLGKELLIPEYQREYVWDEQNWKDFLNQIRYCMGNNKELRLGLIIMADSENGKKVVDGQQRLTTIGLFFSSTKVSPGLNRMPEISEETIKRFRKWWEKEEINPERRADISKWLIQNLRFKELTISKTAPLVYQYHVFTAVNGKGKKLTLEEKVKNYLLSKEYKCKNIEQKICEISVVNGFLEPYTEIQYKEDIPRNELYHRFKEKVEERMKIGEPDKIVEEMYEYLMAYHFVNTGNAEKQFSIVLDNEDWIWVRMYAILRNVHTADGVLMEAVRKYLYKIDHFSKEKLIALYRKIVFLYFVMYTMDRSGNDKKSLNSKLPKIIGWEAEKIVICNKRELPSSLLTESERGILFKENRDRNVAEIIWDEYIRNAEIMKLNKETARFVLYFIEYWLGLSAMTLNNILKGELKEDNPEIPELEHIHPASKDKDKFTKSLNLNCLENCCLLESNINKSVSDKYLYEGNKDKDRGKLAYFSSEGPVVMKQGGDTRTSTYIDSVFVMPQEFYNEEKSGKYLNAAYYESEDGKKYMYTKKCAEHRMSDIRERVFNFGRYQTTVECLIKDM